MLSELEFKQLTTSIEAYLRANDAKYYYNDIHNQLINYKEPKNDTFELCEEDYEDQMQYIHITENGKTRFELWQWKDIIVYNDLFKRLIDSEISHIELYKVIKKHAQLIKKAGNWKKIRE